VLNALVFQHFDGALVTGVQMNDDGTARIDFDLPKRITTDCARLSLL
jgi:misacylated tRNA(Ala) deacylase